MPYPTFIQNTEVRFLEDTVNGVHYVALKAPDSIAADVTLTLPATDGASGEVLRTDGNGSLTFVMGAEGLVAADNAWTGVNLFDNSSEATVVGAGAVIISGGIFVSKKIITSSNTEATIAGDGSVITNGGVFAAKKIITSSSVRTAAPTTGTANDWKLGSQITSGTSALDTTKYVEVEIGGALVKLAVVTNS